jgi:hypothetical protein
MALKSDSDLYTHDRHDKAFYTKCRRCGRAIGNFFAARVSHGRAHVRKGQAVEYLDEKSMIAFRIPGTS